MAQETSRQAYKDVVSDLGHRQRMVLTLFNDRSIVLTNNEIAQKLGWAINTVTPRVFELRHKGELVQRGKRPCKITGRTGITWGLPGMKTDFFRGTL
jgi:predicted transcriptional regulator